MAQKKIPARQCIGCMTSRPKKELVRVVRAPSGEISIDPVGKKPGRGAYLCPDPACLAKAKKKKALERCFEQPVPAEVYDALAAQLADVEKEAEFGDKFKFDITQVIGLTNDDEVSRVFRPYKQMIERLNRTYKVSYRPTNGFDNIDGANYDLALWVAYYNFLRPHKHAGCKVLNKVEMLEGAENMPGKWQLLIFLGQQTILNLQNQASA